jgi:hypothetical protein
MRVPLKDAPIVFAIVPLTFRRWRDRSHPGLRTPTRRRRKVSPTARAGADMRALRSSSPLRLDDLTAPVELGWLPRWWLAEPNRSPSRSRSTSSGGRRSGGRRHTLSYRASVTPRKRATGTLGARRQHPSRISIIYNADPKPIENTYGAQRS